MKILAFTRNLKAALPPRSMENWPVVWHGAVLDPTGKALIVADCRQPLRGSTVACFFYAYPGGDVPPITSGGYAKGGGYHKLSAAFAAALEQAGFLLDADIDGRGSGAMREALQALAAYWFPGKATIVHTRHF